MKRGQQCSDFGSLPWSARADIWGLSVAIAGLSAWLWPIWRSDDNLSHGVLLPLLSGILFFECRRADGIRFVRPGVGLFSSGLVLLLAGITAACLAVLYASGLGWNYSTSQFMMTGALVLVLGAGWLALADNRLRFLPLNWAAAAAILLWLFAAPPPPGTYARLSLFLEGRVTDVVVHIMRSVGIAAYRDGNLIELARSKVGVSDACSGVRSLISCTVAGIFLSGVAVRRPLSRACVIVLSPVIGLAMNVVRSLALTLVASTGANIEGRWHDLTGESIIVLTTLLVCLLAFWFRRHEGPPLGGSEAPESTPGAKASFPKVLAGALCGVLVCSVILVVRSHPNEPANAPVVLAPLFPPAPAGWVEVATPGMDQYSGILRTSNLAERIYSGRTGSSSGYVSLYLAYWRPGEAPVSLVDAHTPDACWPGTGWEEQASSARREPVEVAGRTLAPAESRSFVHGRDEANVWFWHLYGRKPVAYVDPYSVARILKMSFRYGLRRPEEQLFVRVSSNQTWDEISRQPMVRQFFKNLQPLGL